MSGNDTPVLDGRNLSKSFARTLAVADASLQCQSGELVTVLGASGCGKSTLLRLISGHEQPDRGQVFIQGNDVTALPPEQRLVHMVFQSYALFPHLTVQDNIAYGLKIARQKTSTVKRLCGEIIELMQLNGLELQLPAQLSGGQQQRVALARALVMKPAALLLDEPLAALDAKLREQMRSYLGVLQASLGITFLLVTHDQEEALALSQRLIFMNEGRILQCDTPETVYRLPANYIVASFLGRMAFLPGSIDAAGNLSSPAFNGSVALKRNLPAAQVRIGIRPEHVTLASSTTNGKLTAKVSVEQVEFYGQSKLITVVGANHTRMAAWLHADNPIPEGKLLASWEAANMLVFDAEGVRLAWN